MVATSSAAPEAKGTSGTHARLDHVQGLRGIAVALVVIYHAGLPARAGFVGVDIFFVISGFVITRLLVREVGEHRRIRFGRFYQRRIRRLLPAFALTTSVTVILSGLLQSPVGGQHDTGIVALGASVWSANIALFAVTLGYFGANPATVPLLHTWSLAVEEQFYLVFPALTAIGFALGRRTRRGRRAGAAWVLSAAFVVSFVVSWALSYSVIPITSGPGLAYFAAPTRAWEFVAGALVALRISRKGAALPPRLAEVLAVVGVVVMVGSGFLLRTPIPFPGFGAVPPVLAAAVVLYACATPGLRTSSILSQRWLMRIGDLSYSWYLWHWPFVVFAALLFHQSVLATTIAVAISYPVAAFTYERVEQPFRQRQPKRRHATVGMVAVCVAIPVLLATVLLVGSAKSWGDQDIKGYADQLSEDNGVVPVGCISRDLLSERNMKRCTVPAEGDAEPILLVGDSNAWQYVPGVGKAAAEAHRTLTVATAGGCPLIDVEVHQQGASWAECRDWYVDAVDWLEDQPKATIVVASANRFLEDDDFRLEDPTDGHIASDPAGKQRIWQAGLTRTFAALRDSGHDVLQVNVSPQLFRTRDDFVPWDPRQCSFPELLGDVADCGVTRSRSFTDALQRRALAAEHGAAEATGIRELDLRDEICRGSTCSTNRGKDRLYADGLHISVHEARRLAPRFVEAFESGGGS
jgi:peptidoglycan/LPS O-acetylase OafA/YrhL